MTLWGRTRDEVLRRTHQLGRQVALGLVEAMQRALAGDRRVHVVGGWPQVFAALGLPQPSGKAARAALALVAEVTDAVVRVTSHTWRVVSHAADVAEGEQLDLAWDPNGKGESGPALEQEPASPGPSARTSPRARARASALERLFGLEPLAPRPRALSRAVEASGALDRGEAWDVTLTAAALDGFEAQVAEWAARWPSVQLVPELSPGVRRLHFHGIVLAPPGVDRAELEQAWCDLGGGSFEAKRIPSLRRLRAWASYAWKAKAEGIDVVSSGLLDHRPIAQPQPTVERDDPAPTKGSCEADAAQEQGALGRLSERLRAVWKRWRGR